MRKYIWPAAFIVIPLAVRLVHIAGPLLWYDEAFTLLVARLPFGRMMAAVVGDVHPPLWYWIAGLMARLSSAPWIIRLPSVLFGAGACWMFWLVAGRLAIPERVRRLAFAWMVISPFQLYFSQEARMYALMEFLVLLAVWSVLEKHWSVFAIATALQMYTNNYGIFYAASVFVFAVLMDRRSWARPLLACAAAGVVYLPWLAVMVMQMRTLSAAGYWIQPVTFGSVLYTLDVQFWGMTLPAAAKTPAIYLTCLLLVAGLVWLIWKRPANWAAVLVMALGPVALAILAGWIYRPVLLFRSIIGCAPFLYLLVCWPAAGLEWNRRRVLYAACFIAPLALVGFVSYYLSVDGIKKDYGLTASVQGLRDQFRSGDLICSTSDGGVIVVAIYGPESPLCKITLPVDEPGALSPATRQALGFELVTMDALPSHKHLWLYAGYNPLQPAEEVNAIRKAVIGLDLLDTFSDDVYLWSGVYYASK